MPNNTNERKGKQAGELSAEERFRNFFSTSVIDLPEEMTRRDEPAPVEEKPKAGLLGKLFSHDKEETPAPAQPVLEIPTGEILLGADAKPVQPEQEDMALELRTADPVPAMPMQPASPEPAKAVPAEPVPAPKAAAAVQPEPEKPAPQPVPQPVAAPQKQPKAKNAPETLLPQEELEQREMQQLKDMLNGMSGKAKPAPQPAKPVQAAPQPKVQPAPAQPAAEPEKAPAKAAQNAAEELPPVVFASAPADPETLPKKPEKKSIFQMFGTAEDEKPAARKPEKEDTMSLPLLPLEQDGTPAAETAASVSAPAAAATPAQPETAPEAQAAAPAEETVPESTADKLHHLKLIRKACRAGIARHDGFFPRKEGVLLVHGAYGSVGRTSDAGHRHQKLRRLSLVAYSEDALSAAGAAHHDGSVTSRLPAVSHEAHAILTLGQESEGAALIVAEQTRRCGDAVVGHMIEEILHLHHAQNVRSA